MTFKLKAPLFGQVELTKRCNHSCYYCYNHFNHNSNSSMSIKEIKKVISQFYLNSLFSMIFTGGEPFMNRKGLNFALDSLDTDKLDIYINTNLSLPISSLESERLKKTKLVLISFPSHKPELFNETVGRNSFIKVLSNLERLVSDGVNVSINQVVTQKNKEEVYNTARFLYEQFGVTSFSATPIVPIREKDKEYQLDRQEILRVSETLFKLEKEFGMETDMLTCIPPCFFPPKM